MECVIIMIIAIYSRKSVFTGKGDSIENQVQLCKEYIEKNFFDEEITYKIYEDEGFSGGNTNRPQFKELLNDANRKKFKVLICYRLDRISRNVSDFSSTLDLLQKNDIDFISIKEQFDTSTPMGRAMIYIASVFAQLERETIAERVKDNMLELAKSGRWLGGQTPLGFNSKPITYLDENFKERTIYILDPIEEELDTVRLIYSKYNETKSLRQTYTFLLQHNIKTKNGRDWNVKSISEILSAPVYVKSSPNVIKYLSSLGIKTIGTPNGNGFLTYNKKKGKYTYRNQTDWIAAVSNHTGIIADDFWIKIQHIKNSNKAKSPKLGKTHNTLLSGLIRCSKCNSPMRVVHGRMGTDGNKIYYYACTLKQNSKGIRCNMHNIRADYADKEIIEALKNYLVIYPQNLISQLEFITLNQINKKSSMPSLITTLEKEKLTLERSIENLIVQLSENPNSSACKYIIKAMENNENKLKDLINKINLLKKEIAENSTINSDVNNIVNYINNAIISYENSDITKLKKYLCSIIDNVVIDVEKDYAEINFISSK